MFKSLTGDDANYLSQSKTCTRYRKGQVLFHEGTRPMGVFCVNSGRVKVYRLGQDGKEHIIKVSASGDLLGYKALLSDQLYNQSGEALDDCIVCFVPKEDFLSLIRPGNKFYADILKMVCAENNELANKMTQLAQQSVRQRLAISLLMLKDTYGLEHESEGEIEINLSREDLANIVGTATESLIRLLHDFKEEGLIETAGRKIRVLKPQGLIQAAKR